MNNKVSIIIPCYNQAHFLNDAVKSIIEQTHTNWECIIINDGSTDNTENCALKLVEKDNRIIYKIKNNEGLSSARNAGLKIATGDFIQFLDADDYIDNTKFEKSIEEIVKDNQIKIVVSNFKMFDKNIERLENPYCKITQSELSFQVLLNHWDDYFTIPIHCGFFSRNLFEIFRFPSHIHAKEDWIMWTTIFKAEPKAIFINDYLAFYRRNQNSMTMTKDMTADYLKAIYYFKNLLTKDEYEMFLISVIKNKLKNSNHYKIKFLNVIHSKSYVFGQLIKKILKKINLLNATKKCINPIFKRFQKQ